MDRITRLIRLLRSSIFLAAISILSSHMSDAADPSKIQESILKGQQYILQRPLTNPQGTLAALAYVKSGGDKKNPAILQVVQYVLAKSRNAAYWPSQHYNYEAGVDLMLLEAIDGETYRPRMEAIVAFLIASQQSNGSWFYNHDIEPDCGDTSITQYALLGLWAAARTGIEIPVDVWEKSARWHIAKQRDDGGFAYHPFDHKHGALPERIRSSGTMTAAGSSNLLIIRRVLFDDADWDAEMRPVETKRRFGVLERFVEEKASARRNLQTVPTLRPDTIDKSLKGGIRWTSSHFTENSPTKERWFCYYFYCIERVAALMDVDKIGTHDWYDEGAEELLKRQAADGSWTDECTPLASTALALMFLSKATTTVIAPRRKVELVGGGLQAGGRGLPDNLGAVEVKEGTVSARKIVGQVDDLLIELERSSDAKVADIQAAVVDAVQLDHADELIGQIARLRKLANDPRVEVRRTALWALGRSGDLTAAKLLIQGLSDPEISVVREASLGLCILSRRPDGCGKPIDPTDDDQMEISDKTTVEERKAKLSSWQVESQKRWSDWYQKNRPYGDRDDRSAIKPTIR